MSGYTDVSTCPNCGSERMNTSVDYKPFDHVQHECPDCGLIIYPAIEYRDLNELNELREEWDMEPLTELPEQNKDF